MVEWFGQKQNSELFTPLLPPGSDDDPGAADEASAYAEFKDALRRRPSSYGDAKRRRRKLHRLQSHAKSMKNFSRQFTDVSAASEETHPIDNTLRSTYSEFDDAASDEMSYYGPQTAREFEKEVPREKLTPEAMAKSAAVVLVTIAGMASFLAAFAASAAVSISSAATIAVGVAGGVCILTTPLVWVSEYRLTHLPALRSRVNLLREEANRFQKEIEILIEEEEDLRIEVEILKEDQKSLETLVKEKNAGNVEDFVALVHENQMILDEMKENLRQAVLQDVVKMVVQSDIDRDGMLSKKEANMLAARLSIMAKVYGIVFDADKFHRAVGLSPSLGGVMKIVKRLLPNEDDGDASFNSMESESDDEESVDDDVYDMFYVPVEANFNKGCAESIRLCKEYVATRGRRPSLMSIAPSARKSIKGLRCSIGLGGCDP